MSFVNEVADAILANATEAVTADNASSLPPDTPAEPPATDSTSDGADAAESKPEDLQPGETDREKTILNAIADLPDRNFAARAELENQIAEQQTIVADLAVDRLRKEIVAKSAKTKLDDAVEELERMESDMAAGRFPLPFSGSLPDGSIALPGSAASLPGQLELPISDGGTQNSTVAETDESWRLVSIGNLTLDGKKLSSGIIKALQEAELTTLGAIADYTADGNWLDSLDGIGKGKAEDIEDAAAEYWLKNPRGTSTLAAELRSDGYDAANLAELKAAYTAGCESMLGWDADEEMPLPKNPHAAGSQLNKAFDKGVQDTLTA